MGTAGDRGTTAPGRTTSLESFGRVRRRCCSPARSRGRDRKTFPRPAGLARRGLRLAPREDPALLSQPAGIPPHLTAPTPAGTPPLPAGGCGLPDPQKRGSNPLRRLPSDQPSPTQTPHRAASSPALPSSSLALTPPFPPSCSSCCSHLRAGSGKRLRDARQPQSAHLAGGVSVLNPGRGNRDGSEPARCQCSELQGRAQRLGSGAPRAGGVGAAPPPPRPAAQSLHPRPGRKSQLAPGAEARLQLAPGRAGTVTPPAPPAPFPPPDQPRGGMRRPAPP